LQGIGEVEHPGNFTFVERTPGTHSMGAWMCHRAGFDVLEKRKISYCWE